MSMSIKQSNQQGFVAIFSVLIIMGILTLITIGFSTVVRQAQSRTLNEHLNSQAFYAAESGVSMAASALADGENVSQKNDCAPGSFDYDINNENNIKVSCLLINGNPPNLEFGNVPVVGTGEPVTSRLETLSGDDISNLRIDWDSPEEDDGSIEDRPLQSGNPQFLPTLPWGDGVGVVRLDLVPAGESPANRQDVANSAYTVYLYPSITGGTSIPASPGLAGQGVTLVTRCNSTNGYRCSANVSLSGSGSSSYYVRLQSYYNPVRARVAAVDGSGNEVTLTNGQAIVDSTGQANDVYRRIQVRIPLSSNEGFHPPFAIFSGDSICKRYIGIPGNTAVDLPGGVSDPSCNIN